MYMLDGIIFDGINPSAIAPCPLKKTCFFLFNSIIMVFTREEKKTQRKNNYLFKERTIRSYFRWLDGNKRRKCTISCQCQRNYFDHFFVRHANDICRPIWNDSKANVWFGMHIDCNPFATIGSINGVLLTINDRAAPRCATTCRRISNTQQHHPTHKRNLENHLIECKNTSVVKNERMRVKKNKIRKPISYNFL